jgi:hypothetical protein
MSHGGGPQSDEDAAVALLAATFIRDPDVQMAAAIAGWYHGCYLLSVCRLLLLSLLLLLLLLLLL